MDVNTMVNVTTNLSAVSGNQGVNTAARAGKSQAADTTDEAASQKAEGGAYALELSEDAGKAGAQAQNEAIKGLTSEQVDVLKAGIEKSQQLMIKTLTEQNARLQGWLDLGIGTLNPVCIKHPVAGIGIIPAATAPPRNISVLLKFRSNKTISSPVSIS